MDRRSRRSRSRSSAACRHRRRGRLDSRRGARRRRRSRPRRLNPLGPHRPGSSRLPPCPCVRRRSRRYGREVGRRVGVRGRELAVVVVAPAVDGAGIAQHAGRQRAGRLDLACDRSENRAAGTHRGGEGQDRHANLARRGWSPARREARAARRRRKMDAAPAERAFAGLPDRLLALGARSAGWRARRARRGGPWAAFIDTSFIPQWIELRRLDIRAACLCSAGGPRKISSLFFAHRPTVRGPARIN